MSTQRRGATLIIVAGLAAILLTTAIVFVTRLRSAGDEATTVMQDAQARLMLVAALQYIQERSRLGWGEETYGWTDVRSGEVGPIGKQDPKTGRITYPGWHKADYRDDNGVWHDKFNDKRITTPGQIWPQLGTVFRGDCYSMRRPPYAIEMTRTPNPYPNDPEWLMRHSRFAKKVKLNDKGQIHTGSWKNDMDAIWRDIQAQAGPRTGLYATQPVAETWTEFETGDRTPVLPSVGLGWFRIYREMPVEHDGIPNNAPDNGAGVKDWYDTVPLSGHGVFIIACGSGSSRGYRWWDDADPFIQADLEKRLEAKSAKESGLFANIDIFDSARRDARVLWFRAEWTGSMGGMASTREMFEVDDQHQRNGPTGKDLQTPQTYRITTGNPGSSFFGAFKWIQRLEREPPRW